MFSIFVVLALCISVSYQQQRSAIVSKPRRPLIGRSGGDITFNWTFTLEPGRTWNESITEVVFGIWKATGYIMPKLMVITKQGQVLTKPNLGDKVSCKFNMSRLQVAFMLHNISVLDEKQYALQVEFGLARNPLTDVVMLLLHDPPEITSPLKRNIYLRIGADLDLKCEAKGLPDPQVTWSRKARLIKNETLVLRQVTKDDSGVYLCKANNAAGEDRIEVNVIVDDEQESIQNTVSSGTTSESTSGHLSLTLTIVSGFVVLIIFVTVLLYRYRGRLKRSIPYGTHIDIGKPSPQSAI